MSEQELKNLITKTEIRKTVSANFKYLRNQLNLSVVDMGAKIGCSRQNYQAIEAGNNIGVDNILNMARLCNISMENILMNDLSKQGIKKRKPATFIPG